jgi:hypothetical protein
MLSVTTSRWFWLYQGVECNTNDILRQSNFYAEENGHDNPYKFKSLRLAPQNTTLGMGKKRRIV